MTIGIFDSGLGGLYLMKYIVRELPPYDYVFYGDTAHIPYGNRSREDIYNLTKRAVEFLFKKNCAIVVLACNTASAVALRKLQTEWLPKKYPDRKILGIIVPVAEASAPYKCLGVIGTKATIASGVFPRLFKRYGWHGTMRQQSAPELATAIERGDEKKSGELVQNASADFARNGIDALLLGCTHYPVVKNYFEKYFAVPIISQESVVPKSLAAYLAKHPEIETALSKQKTRTFYASKETPVFKKHLQKWFGKNAKLRKE